MTTTPATTITAAAARVESVGTCNVAWVCENWVDRTAGVQVHLTHASLAHWEAYDADTHSQLDSGVITRSSALDLVWFPKSEATREWVASIVARVEGLRDGR